MEREAMILITGATGQLGYDVKRECERLNLPFLAVGSKDLDITSKQDVHAYFNQHSIDTVIHCAAYTAVDLAEEEKEQCFRVNVQGTENLLNEARNHHSSFVYISTDYVFDGSKQGLYEVSDAIHPLGVYAHSKAEGERIVASYAKHFIVRISWVFGLNGKNFVKTMLRLAQSRTEVGVVSDQIGSPTYTKDAAQLIVEMSQSDRYGTYHVTNEGITSWADFASYIFKSAGLKTTVKKIETKDYPTKAVRPMNSGLSKQALDRQGFKHLPTWQDAVDRYIIELREHGEL